MLRIDFIKIISNNFTKEHLDALKRTIRTGEETFGTYHALQHSDVITLYVDESPEHISKIYSIFDDAGYLEINDQFLKIPDTVSK